MNWDLHLKMNEMDFKKEIWYLFKLDRSEFNRADRNIDTILHGVYEKGKKEGKKEGIKNLKFYLKKI